MTNQIKTIGVLTSGGDAPGMNAAVRAVVRSGLARGLEVYAIYEGYQGMVAGGENIRQLGWHSVGGILQQGGTVIGSARSTEFFTREGRRQAAYHLLLHGIDALVVIGGDGSLTGANIFRQEWPSLLAELVEMGQISQEMADQHPQLLLTGLVGSIDNDMFGTDMTIGADTALHRITEAVDAITSTAASHQRTFVIEVMGRHCGYLALMSALATGANWVLIPESPPDVENWEEMMCQRLKEGHERGRRHNIVLVAEGAQDREGRPISSQYVQKILEKHLGQETRVTILGHVQRGGSASAFDRYLSTVLGVAAVDEVATTPESEPQLIGIHDNDVIHSPLMNCVAETKLIAKVIAAGEYQTAIEMRGRGFTEAFRTLRTLLRTHPHPPAPGQKRLRLAILHSGGPAPGMNTAVRAAVRLGLDEGHTILAIRNGFRGLIDGEIQEIDWMSVHGWVGKGGAELGTNRFRATKAAHFESIAQRLSDFQIDGLLMIGGWAGYQNAYELVSKREQFPAFNIPIICLPASINNNLPGTELSIGADSALNAIVSNVDKIKQSAVAWCRCFVVEVMGRDCGYLALMSGLATGAERVYLPEEGISLHDLQADVAALVTGFEQKKRLGLMICNEKADSIYNLSFLHALFEKEGGDLFDVRQAILGHVQQGATPSPFDRIQATRLVARAISFLIEEAAKESKAAAFIGRQAGQITLTPLEYFPQMIESELQRPKKQWWLRLRTIAKMMAQPGPPSSN